MSNAIFRCNECGWVGAGSDMLQPSLPAHPKTDEVACVNQCPECPSVEDFTNICDEPNCENEAGCGWPSEDGYRRTCGEHMK